MDQAPKRPHAEVVLRCRELAQCVDFFVDLGFRLERIFPADAPRSANLAGHGLAVCLERADVDGGGHLRIAATRARECTAPNGTRIEFAVPTAQRSTRAAATFVVRRGGDGGGWHAGRAGMQYRDLVAGRQDGELIASRIRIDRAGAVPDYVHHHGVLAQIIYCRSGGVRVVYEDQGEPFWLRPGDCVLQPPGIRHRVLECTDGLEVIEVSSPAEHDTWVDHELELPTAELRPEREFAGQRFVRHQANGAVLRPWDVPGFDARETGIGAASRGAIGVRVVRAARSDAEGTLRHGDDRRFWFVLRGACSLAHGSARHRLEENDAAVLPPGAPFALAECTPGLELLEVVCNARPH
ncbi:MAG: cupin [Planctomycetota bacterium]